MPTLHLMVGLPGSGKTTRAREIEAETEALRLTPDEWIYAVLGSEPEAAVLDAARDPVEAMLWEVAARHLVLGGDVILDFGFWSRAERADFAARAAALGALCQIHYCQASLDELWARLDPRNGTDAAGTFRITQDQLVCWARMFEPPDEP